MRLTNWECRLNSAIEAARAAPFEWGVHDCCLFAADVVAATTGIDYAVDYRRRYKTAAEAAALLHRHGFRTIDDQLDFLFDRIDLTLAQRGDLVVTQAHGLAVGIHCGDKLAFVGETGLVFLPAARALAAWRVN